MVDATDSLVFRLLFNSLRLAYEPAIDALGPVMEDEVDNLLDYRELTEAVLGGDAAAARRHSEDLVRPASEALSRLLGELDV